MKSVRKKNDVNKKKGRNYIVSAIWSLLITIPITEWLAPGMIPIDYHTVWGDHGTSLMEWLHVGLPIFCWGVGVNFLIHFLFPVLLKRDIVASGQFLLVGTLRSLWAGITEELAFRWLTFFGAFLGIFCTNWLLFDFAGFGIPEWFFMNIWGPLANWTTFGLLENQIFHESGWLFGASMLAANSFFRDSHRYQGPFGWVNSWFLGMFFFYLMFNYGLLAAIVVHFVYNWTIYLTIAGLGYFEKTISDAARRRRNGY